MKTTLLALMHLLALLLYVSACHEGPEPTDAGSDGGDGGLDGDVVERGDGDLEDGDVEGDADEPMEPWSGPLKSLQMLDLVNVILLREDVPEGYMERALWDHFFPFGGLEAGSERTRARGRSGVISLNADLQGMDQFRLTPPGPNRKATRS